MTHSETYRLKIYIDCYQLCQLSEKKAFNQFKLSISWIDSMLHTFLFEIEICLIWHMYHSEFGVTMWRYFLSPFVLSLFYQWLKR